MKSIITCLLVFSSINILGQSSRLLGDEGDVGCEIIDVCDKLSLLEDEMAGQISNPDLYDLYQDSIGVFNLFLSKLVLSPNLRRLTDSDLKMLAEKTGMTFVASKDGCLRLISWVVYNSFPTPMCSNLLMTRDASVLISLNGTNSEDFGVNTVYNDIQTLKKDKHVFYVLQGSNKCGNLCIQVSAALYSLVGSRPRQCIKAFFDGREYFDTLDFDYLLSDQLSNQINFNIKHNKIFAPVFDEKRTRILRYKEYEISSSCAEP